jgi:hypothetical protein
MSSVCPAGHSSSADDYCDVCGLPIGEQSAAATPDGADDAGVAGGAGAAAADAAPPAPAGTPADVPATCPHCQAVNPPNALFCEACGYDFTTGSLPRPFDPPAVSGQPEQSAPEAAADAGESAPSAQPLPPAESPVAPPLEPGWVAEIWIDPDWYADQDSADPLPSAGVPTVVPLRSRSLLVGRSSRSRGITPDIDLSSDNGISRRHCQLTTDGQRWWVEDLGSSNGTYVGDAVGPLPTTPLVQGQRRELDGDDRIYLGAWTRLVLRKAAPGEVT